MNYEFKGTPAPWHIHHLFDTPLTTYTREFGRWEHSSPYVMGCGNRVIGDVKYCSIPAGFPSVDNIPEFEANYSLIIAAPELLQACIMALQTISDNGHPDGETAETLRAAIHKALNIS